MVFEKSRLSKQLRRLEEGMKELLSMLSQTALPIDPKIQACATSKFSEELETELKQIGAKLESCSYKGCFNEVEKSLESFSQRLAALEGEVRYLRGAERLELVVLFRELFSCREEPLQIPALSKFIQLCYAEEGLRKIELELEALEEDLRKLQVSEGVHPCLYSIWEKLIQQEERLLGEVREELVKARKVSSSQPCETLRMLGVIARSVDESRSRCEEYKALKLEFFSPKAVESFIPPKADAIFESEEDVKRMLNERIFERIYSVLYRVLPGGEAEREAADLLDRYARCIWHEIKR